MYKKTNWPKIFNQLWSLAVSCVTLFGGGCLLYQQTPLSICYFIFTIIVSFVLYYVTFTASVNDRWLGTIQFITALSLYPLLWSIHANLNSRLSDKLLIKIDTWLGFTLPEQSILPENYWLSELFSFSYLACYIILFIYVVYYSNKGSNAKTNCFFHGLMLIYFLGFLTYFFLPAKGPLQTYHTQYTYPIITGKITAFLTMLINHFDIGLTASSAMPCAITFYLFGYSLIFRKYKIALLVLFLFILVIFACTYLHFFYSISIITGIFQASLILIYLYKVLRYMYI